MLLKRLGVCNYITDDREQRNALISITDGMLYSVMAGLTSPFWGAFAVELGASDYLLALLSSLPAAIGLASQIPSAIFIERYDNRLRPTLVMGFLARSFFLLFALLVLLPLPAGWKPILFVTLYALRNLPGTACDIAWTSLIGEMFPQERRGRLFGERNMLCTFATLASTVVAGPFLDRVVWPWNYFSLYMISLAAVMGSLYYLTKHKETPLAPDERSKSPRGLGAFRAAATDRPFALFLLAVAAIHIGFHLTGSLWTILWVRIMGLSNAWLGMFSIASGAASLLSYRSWGRWSDRYGNRRILAFTALAHAVFPVVYGHFPNPYVYVVINAVGGFVGAGFSLSIFSLLLDVSPAAGRPAYIATYNTVLGVSGFIWPVVGVWTYRRIGMVATLDVFAIVRLAGMGVAALLLLRGHGKSPAKNAALD